MVLGQEGEAYFKIPISEEIENPNVNNIISPPIPEPTISTDEILPKLDLNSVSTNLPESTSISQKDLLPKPTSNVIEPVPQNDNKIYHSKSATLPLNENDDEYQWWSWGWGDIPKKQNFNKRNEHNLELIAEQLNEPNLDEDTMNKIFQQMETHDTLTADSSASSRFSWLSHVFSLFGPKKKDNDSESVKAFLTQEENEKIEKQKK